MSFSLNYSYTLEPENWVWGLVALAALIAVVATARAPLRRGPYAIGIVVCIAATVVLGVLGAVPTKDGGREVAGILGLGAEGDRHAAVVGWIMLVILLARLRLMAHRLVDTKGSRWWALVGVIPIVGTLVAIALMFPRTRRVRPAETAQVFD